MWESVPEGGPVEGWAEHDENGWEALIGPAAGPEKLRIVPAVDNSARTLNVTRTDKNGTVIKTTEAFTAHDRQIVDEEVNSYLADAGVKQRPGGFRWFVRLPSQFSTWEELRAAVTESRPSSVAGTLADRWPQLRRRVPRERRRPRIGDQSLPGGR